MMASSQKSKSSCRRWPRAFSVARSTVARRAGSRAGPIVRDDIGDDGAHHQAATDQRTLGRKLVEGEPYPERHERRLERRNQGGLAGRQQSRAEDKESEAHSDLEQAEHRKHPEIATRDVRK